MRVETVHEIATSGLSWNIWSCTAAMVISNNYDDNYAMCEDSSIGLSFSAFRTGFGAPKAGDRKARGGGGKHS